MSQRRMKAKLIFNPSAGAARGSPIEIVDVIHEMQAWKLVPEAFLVEPGCDLPGVVQDALAQGIRMFVVCGGDGTISAVAGILGRHTRHPGDHPHRHAEQHGPQPGHPGGYPGRHRHPAHGPAHQSGRWHGHLASSSAEGGECHTLPGACSVGLVSTLFPSADDIQHGNLARVGDFLATLVGSPPAEMHLVLDDKQEIHTLGHVVLVSNMPYIGLHYTGWRRGLVSMMACWMCCSLPTYPSWTCWATLLQGVGTGKSEDPRIQHFHVRRVDIDTQPAMPVMADGIALGEGRVHIEVRRHALAVMVGKPAPEALPGPGEIPEAQTHAAAG